MFEKVNPQHPDKIADRIAGAIVDMAYQQEENPKIAVEVLLGHGYCYVIIESDMAFEFEDIYPVVGRLAKGTILRLISIPQDKHLANNQSGVIRCGDNGIFKGVPVNDEEMRLTQLAERIYRKFPHDGKYILDDERHLLTVCQSNASEGELKEIIPSVLQGIGKVNINPLGFWTGGISVDSGATNRKLGSDMGRGVTGGGLHGKDLSKADVSVNIYAHLLAQEIHAPVELSCSIGDETVGGKPYAEIVEISRDYIDMIGGFEKFAEWGLIRWGG